MNTLRSGSTGDDVLRWQHFLLGQGLPSGEANGVFAASTVEATRAFQRAHGLKDDGIAGNLSIGKAMQLGFDVVPDDPNLPDSLTWPPPPAFPALGAAGRRELFGNYDFKSAPVAGNAEAIQILDGWEAANIELFTIPELAAVKRGNGGRVRLHKKVGPLAQELFSRWSQAGLLAQVLTFDGGYVARFIRGSRSVLSSHAHGSAFDINAESNPLGARPALRGAQGSVRELVEIANAVGFYWGGHFNGRPDGMHFELAKV
jgi:hypothetical protein